MFQILVQLVLSIQQNALVKKKNYDLVEENPLEKQNNEFHFAYDSSSDSEGHGRTS